MLCYQADPTFKYASPVEVKPGAFASASEMREKRIFRNMDAFRSAQRVHEKAMAARKAGKRRKKSEV